MSGSGTSVFGEYSSHRDGLHAYEYLEEPIRLTGMVNQILELDDERDVWNKERCTGSFHEGD